METLAGSTAHAFLPIKEMLGKLPDLQRAATAIFYRKCSSADCAAALKSLVHVYSTIGAHKASIEGECDNEALLDMLNRAHSGLEGIPELLGRLDLEAAAKNDKVNLFVGDAIPEDVRHLKEKIKGVQKELQRHLVDVAITLSTSDLKE